MSATSRPLLSLVAILAAGSVLLADSAEPVCANYAAFEADFSYTTDCSGSGEGTLHLAFAGQSGTSGPPSYGAETLTLESKGLLDLSATGLNFNSESCPEDGEGTGIFSSVTLSFTQGLDSNDLEYTCYGWTGGVADQNLECTASEGSICHISLTVASWSRTP